MRKVLALAVALALVFSMSVAVFATDDGSSTEVTYTKEAPEDPGTGGEDPGTGGEDPGTGGEDPGTGGEDPGTGGEDPGTGGEDPGTGGEDPGTGGEDPQLPENAYTLAIPRSVQLDEECNGQITITPQEFTLQDGKEVAVTLPESDYLDAGSFYIYKDKGEENEARIPLTLHYNKSYIGAGAVVGRFSSADDPASVITIDTSPYNYRSAAAGDYSGTLRFNFEVQDK